MLIPKSCKTVGKPEGKKVNEVTKLNWRKPQAITNFILEVRLSPKNRKKNRPKVKYLAFTLAYSDLSQFILIPMNQIAFRNLIENLRREPKYIVFQSQLLLLFTCLSFRRFAKHITSSQKSSRMVLQLLSTVLVEILLEVQRIIITF